MRIVAGKHRGRVLKEFKGRDIRPTSDMARQALFNILGQTLDGTSFYDAFAGTGAIGLEAISRGATDVVFTDNSQESIKLIKSNAEMLKETPTIIFGDAISYLSNTKKSFDFIFIDPPYSTDLGIKLLETIDKNVEVLAKDGIVVFETDKLMRFVLNNLQLIKEKRYGKAHFYFLGRGNE